MTPLEADGKLPPAPPVTITRPQMIRTPSTTQLPVMTPAVRTPVSSTVRTPVRATTTTTTTTTQAQ
jgi:hypothetical protein